MRKVLLSELLLLFPVLLFSQTQGAMNLQASKDFKKADSILNATYQQVLAEYSFDTLFIKNLKTAEQLWIQFRDAELKSKFPENSKSYYGSVLPMCHSMYLTELTNERTKTLQVWLDGIVEGDVCAGSVKKKE